MKFSFDNFMLGWRAGLFQPPKNFVPYTGFEPRAYHKMKAESKRRSMEDILYEIERRTDMIYGQKLIPLARYSVAYAADTFPAFELVYPEVIGADWLAMTGWQKYQRDHLIHQPLEAYVILKLLNGWLKYDDTQKIIKEEDPLILRRHGYDTPLLDVCVEAVLFSPGCSYIKEYLVKMGMDENAELLNPRCDSTCNFGIAPKERKTRCQACSLWRMLFTEAAFMAAMLHDLGYSWQYAQELMRAADYTNSTTTLRCGDHLISPHDFSNRLLYAVLNGYQFSEASQPSNWESRVTAIIQKAFDETHGLPGAFTFLLLSDAFRDYPKEKSHTYPLRQFILEWASVAICMHDMAKVYRGSDKEYPVGSYPENPQLKVCFHKDPLSAVLSLADYMQEFERHAVMIHRPECSRHCPGPGICNCGMDVTNTYPSFAFTPTCTEVELKVQGGNAAKITFYQNDKASVRNKNFYINRPDGEHATFFSKTGFLDYSWLGIDRFELVAEIDPQKKSTK